MKENEIWGYNKYKDGSDSWKYILSNPTWLKRLSMRREYRGGFYIDIFKDDIIEKPSTEIVEEIVCVSRYPSFVSRIGTSEFAGPKNKKLLDKEIFEIEEFYSKHKLPDESFKEVVEYISLGAIGIFGGHMIHPYWSSGSDFTKEAIKKGFPFKSGRYLVQKLNLYNEAFIKLVREEFERELFRGNLKRFFDLKDSCYSEYSAEAIAKYILEDKELEKKAATDRFKTKMFGELEYLLSLMVNCSDLHDQKFYQERYRERDRNIEYTIRMERELSGILDERYMREEIKKFRDIIQMEGKRIDEIYQYYIED